MTTSTEPRSGVTGAVLEVEDVTYSFGDVPVLEAVSFAVDAGTVACLVGPNGSGKTTLLRLVAGVLEPDSGTVGVPDAAGRAVGYLAQQPAFRRQLTVLETIEFYGALVERSIDPAAVLGRVGLSAVAGRRTGALSGGMKRLLGIAQTTVGDPPVVVLDEPSSGLDPTMTRQIIDVIDGLAADGGAILMSTHDLDAVRRLADLVLVVDRGEVLASGPPGELLADTGAETLEAALGTLRRDEGPVGVSIGGGGVGSR